jgi:hypothetical protein
LLGNHDHETGQSRTANTRDGEKLREARDVVALADDSGFDLELAVNVVQVAGSLDWVVAEAEKRRVSLLIAVLLHEPTWRFRAEVDAEGERNSWDESGSDLKAPSDGSDLVDSEVGAEAQENSESGPHLPGHDESSTDASRRVLSGEDGHGTSLQTHSDSHEDTSDE